MTRNALINHGYHGNSSSLNDIVPNESRLWIKTLQPSVPLLLISNDRGRISYEKKLPIKTFFFNWSNLFFKISFPLTNSFQILFCLKAYN